MDSEQGKALLLDAPAMKSAVQSISSRIFAEFFENGQLQTELAFIGIQHHGVSLARRIASEIEALSGFKPPVGTLDISMYRDDIGMRKSLPAIRETAIPFDIDRQAIVLVDDVLQTGRTIRAALDALTDYGRPRLIRLAVLIDRGMREFPIGADYVGSLQRVPASVRIAVQWGEEDGEDVVVAIRKPDTSIAGSAQ